MHQYPSFRQCVNKLAGFFCLELRPKVWPQIWQTSFLSQLLPGACYDFTTVGAFTAYAQKFKHGGLRKMLRRMREVFSENLSGKPKLDSINEVLNDTIAVREGLDHYCEAVCLSAVQGDSADLNNNMAALSDKASRKCLSQMLENEFLHH